MDGSTATMNSQEPLVLAVPKGRILKEAQPLIEAAGILPELDFNDLDSRKLRFATNIPHLEIIRVRSFDVATFVAFGAAHLAIAGNDVIDEFNFAEIYTPLDLNIGHCRLSVAATKDLIASENPTRWSHVRVATKYPLTTRRHFASQGVQAECIKLNGAMELAPALGLCRRMVDLVSTGATLKANGLIEVEKIAQISSRLIVNRSAMKTRPTDTQYWIRAFSDAVENNRASAAA